MTITENFKRKELVFIVISEKHQRSGHCNYVSQEAVTAATNQMLLQIISELYFLLKLVSMQLN